MVVCAYKTVHELDDISLFDVLQQADLRLEVFQQFGSQLGANDGLYRYRSRRLLGLTIGQ